MVVFWNNLQELQYVYLKAQTSHSQIKLTTAIPVPIYTYYIHKLKVQLSNVAHQVSSEELALHACGLLLGTLTPPLLPGLAVALVGCGAKCDVGLGRSPLFLLLLLLVNSAYNLGHIATFSSTCVCVRVCVIKYKYVCTSSIQQVHSQYNKYTLNTTSTLLIQQMHSQYNKCTVNIQSSPTAGFLRVRLGMMLD